MTMKEWKTGYTTGVCAAAAAKAAAIFLATGTLARTVDISLPDGKPVSLPVMSVQAEAQGAAATVRKDGGDDPDITHNTLVVATLSPLPDGKIRFAAGEGVGIVTKPGLSILPGEPAINPVPRRMIENAIREVTQGGMLVTVSIPGGKEMAEKTFNPRLGIRGGLSILGTTGIVRPFSVAALHASIQCALDVAAACGVTAPVLVPGNIGRRSAQGNFPLREEQSIEAGNEWGFLVDTAAGYDFDRILVLGHPGKLVKLAAGQWDTHSARSKSALSTVERRAGELFARSCSGHVTVEGLFASLPAEAKEQLANTLADEGARAIAARLETRGKIAATAMVLIDMQGRILGSGGDLAPWRQKE